MFLIVQILSSSSIRIFVNLTRIKMAPNALQTNKVESVTFKCVKEFQKILECPICFVTPSEADKVKFCSNGHLICGACQSKGKFTVCPVCKSKDLNGQNPLLKKILSALPSLCPYEGCDAEPKDTELEGHKKTCQYRPINCLMKECSVQDIPFHEFLKHLEKEHVLNRPQEDKTIIIGYNFGITIDDNKMFENPNLLSYWNPNLLSLDGQTFLVRCIMKNKLFHCQCFLYGTKLDATKYFYEMSVKSKVNPIYSTTFTGEVISLDVPRTDYESDECLNTNFTLSTCLARKLINTNTKVIEVRVKINKRQ